MSVERPLYGPTFDMLAWLSWNPSNPFKNMNNGWKGIWYINNEATRASDVFLQLQIKFGSTITGVGGLDMYVATSVDGLVYTDNLSIDHFDETRLGISSVTKSRYITSLVPVSTGEVIVEVLSLREYFDILPRFMGFIFKNNTASNLDAVYSHGFIGSYVTYEHL